jgi:tRNA(fMet)-specific endonuclease VapC
MFMLDTNICIYLIKGKYPAIEKTLYTKAPTDVCLSSITVAELYAGVNKSQAPEKAIAALESFLAAFDVLDFDFEAAVVYGELRATLEKIGTPIGPQDLFIAAHALSQNLVLVTHDNDFQKVKNLKTEDWTC